MHPYQYASSHPQRPAFVIADKGLQLSYAELEERSNKVAHLFRQHGLAPGDRAGVILKNTLDFPVIYWGAQRSGIILTLISTHLKPEEAAYILNDSHSRLLISDNSASEVLAVLASSELTPGVEAFYDAGEQPAPGTSSFHEALAPLPGTPIADQTAGYHLLYSSGTTGRPKGIAHKFTPGPIENLSPTDSSVRLYQAFDPLVTFTAGPVYHGAPLHTLLLTHRLGGTFVTLSKFDEEQTLKAIQDWHISVAQFVPTMFVRMLALPQAVRESYDLSSLRYVSHAAAPCPAGIKQQMFDWLGPIIHEYYSSTENLGATYIGPQEWLQKPGSVGKSVTGKIHICDEETGAEKPAGEPGLIYFELGEGRGFDYINEPEKTRKVRHPTEPDWGTPGDIGYLDEDGYLFLTDRKDFTIISGGVNIYPQIIEDTLIVHRDVLDAAVIGVPNPEFGEEVKAIIQLKDPDCDKALVKEELIRWCKSHTSSINCPRSFEFVDAIPRLPSGKLAKHELRRLYGSGSAW
ncbi:AMP-binding protein [Pseudomaricurvus sp. HS19]|uniref:AMP-binding protein n=1 Tax=Pseudomaricurvus sp. HS19 TaxID=2692626 RepID=UPI00136D6B35|nr:AMP-binding protein [Pseudomaricurvus sp. HS19]MYM61821.1 AMP-binding protein [Pseudomaricurvus sp. HS19]